MKYELTTDSITHNDVTLYRIKALKDFGNVKAGELGGYVQSLDNLSQEGLCWIYSDAKVFGNAEVFGGAHVFGYARVFGSAQIFDNAKVFGGAQVFGSAKVSKNANIEKQKDYIVFSNVGSEYGTLTAYRTADAIINCTRGCFVGTLEEFKAAVISKHGDSKVGRHYQAIIEVISKTL